MPALEILRSQGDKPLSIVTEVRGHPVVSGAASPSLPAPAVLSSGLLHSSVTDAVVYEEDKIGSFQLEIQLTVVSYSDSEFEMFNCISKSEGSGISMN